MTKKTEPQTTLSSIVWGKEQYDDGRIRAFSSLSTDYDESGVFRGLEVGKQGYAPIIILEVDGVTKKYGTGIAALRSFVASPPPVGTPIRIRSYGHEDPDDPKSKVKVTITYPKDFKLESQGTL
jgi:hypothetical protein